MRSLDQLRQTFARAFIAFLWLNGGLTLFAVLWRQDGGWMQPAASLALAVGSTAMWRADAIGQSTRIVTSAAAGVQVALLVYAFAGQTYQIDMHMYCFAVLAVTAGWVDARAILANAAIVAVHHIILNFLLPYAIFPAAAPDFARLVIHAAILITQAAVLCWLTLRLQAAFETADTATHAAEEATVYAPSRNRSQMLKLRPTGWRKRSTPSFGNSRPEQARAAVIFLVLTSPTPEPSTILLLPLAAG